jgi:serine/threonine-protein kinase RsbW
MNGLDPAPLTLSGDARMLGESLARLREYVSAVADSAGLPADATHRLRLAIDEIATNIITHGYPAAARPGVLDVSATIAENTVTIALDDTAAPYSPLEQQPPADLGAPLEKRTEGGLGVYLALRSVDGFRYERIGEHNRNSFVMKRPSRSGIARTGGTE